MNESAFVTKIPKLVTHVRNSNSLVSLSLKNGSGPCVSGPGSLGAAEPVEIAVAKVLVREQGPRDDPSAARNTVGNSALFRVVERAEERAGHADTVVYSRGIHNGADMVVFTKLTVKRVR